VVNAGLSPTIVSASSDTVTAGRVIRVDPGGGTMLDGNSTVTLVISTGPKAVATPTPTPTPPAP
jgi:beta-lactam-binding protein with PASTA domain